MLAFNCMQRNAGLRSLALHQIDVCIVMRAAKNYRWRPQLGGSKGFYIVIRDREDRGSWKWQPQVGLSSYFSS
jgi:hypothetical protein